MRAVWLTKGASWAPSVDKVAYALTAAYLTLAVATQFYGSLRLQTLYAMHWARPADFEQLIYQRQGPWSAPLDDVFIHFDFARSTARGFPFQWSEGNGYSSGGTSLLYPLVLALGYWAGWRDLRLMEWAAIVACVCTFAVLLAARRWTRDLPRLVGYLLPFGLLSVGTLDWALFSGMEVALFLALWVLAYLAYDILVSFAANESPRRVLWQTVALGICSGLLTATRPEGITCAAVFALAAAWARRRHGWKQVLLLLLVSMAPAVSVVLGQTIANRVFTGENTAAGALVKLEAHHPYLSGKEVWDSWLFFIKYQILRITQYHFADRPAYGWLVWALGASALAFSKTRRHAAILWICALGWVLLVAANGQVRWQNERYSMPAAAWLLGAASLGTGALLTYAWELRRKIRGALIATGTLVGVSLFLIHQAPRFREQLWFFGRASRNIFDQHVQAGLLLRYQVAPTPQRVLVGDAGAIPYVSDLPALDLIGLGGYHTLPFARATRQHVGAGIELIERMAPEERPDLLAIYPGWWAEFPLWFGKRIGEVPVRGNVICGGASKVLYRPDWSPLNASSQPFSLRAGERLLDAVDLADLVSEREHAYHLEGAPGYVSMKLLESPRDRRPLWDAGRTVPPNAVESFQLSGLDPARPLRLVVRAAPTDPVDFEVAVDGKSVGRLRMKPNGGWVEASLEHLRVKGPRVSVRLGPSDHERIEHHIFAIAEP